MELYPETLGCVCPCQTASLCQLVGAPLANETFPTAAPKLKLLLHKGAAIQAWHSFDRMYTAIGRFFFSQTMLKCVLGKVDSIYVLKGVVLPLLKTHNDCNNYNSALRLPLGYSSSDFMFQLSEFLTCLSSKVLYKYQCCM